MSSEEDERRAWTRAGWGELLASIQGRTALVGVVGLGYVGLPLAVAFGESGLRYLGVDTDPRKRASLDRGCSYIGDVSDQAVQSLVAAGRLATTGDCGELAQADAIILCVPTPLSSPITLSGHFWAGSFPDESVLSLPP